MTTNTGLTVYIYALTYLLFTSSGLDSSTTTLVTDLFSAGCLVSFYRYCFIEIPVSNANSVDPDQTLCLVTSELGLHCLPSTLFGVSRLKWIEVLTTIISN